MIEKSPKCTQRHNEECSSVGTEGGRSIRCVQERQARHHLYRTPFPCWQLIQHSPFLLCPCLSRFHRPISKATTTPPRKHVCTCYFLHFIAVSSRFFSHFFYCKMQNSHQLTQVCSRSIVSITACCKQKVPSQTQGRDTMEHKGRLSFLIPMQTAVLQHFAKGVLHCISPLPPSSSTSNTFSASD